MDSANEQANVAGQLDESKLPYWMSIARELRAAGIAGKWLTVADADGKVTPETRQCLDVIAKYDMVMATGHISPAEMEPVIKAAKEAGVQRIIITHPEFPTTHLDLEDQKLLQQYDVYFERVFTTPFTNKCTWDETLQNIRKVGPSSTVVATDLGQTTNPGLQEGFEMFIGQDARRRLQRGRGQAGDAPERVRPPRRLEQFPRPPRDSVYPSECSLMPKLGT